MRYRNAEMKIDQLVNYLNDEKINLSPAFQRGHVWSLKTRCKLVRNIVLGKPIPAVFLYKEAVGSKYTYNILDGKQRLESLILFIADGRPDVSIRNWSRYFFGNVHSDMAKFRIDVPDGKKAFTELSDEAIRDFREYAIPTIEISMEEDSSLDEVITLFVDINQQGEPVKRFDIVKAMYKNDPLMKGAFNLIAVEQTRGQDIFYKPRNNEFTGVLKQLRAIDNIKEPNSKVDLMWEKILEVASFVRTREHRTPVAILKDFITSNRPKPQKLSVAETRLLRTVFRFYNSLKPKLGKTRIFTDQTHSYTVITSTLRADLLEKHGEAEFTRKLAQFAKLLEGQRKPQSSLNKVFREYLENAAKQTTHVSRRKERDRLFVELINAL